MKYSHDKYRLAKGTMSPQKSTFNQFNGSLDRYLENMMQKYLFGRWISESIPYKLASTNTKAVRLWEKTIVAKLDNEEYLLKKDGGTIPQNQVHEAFLYPDFERFLQSKCTINLDNSLLIRHENAIRLLAEEGYNIWGENVREEFNEFKNDVKDIILTANNQGHQVEQGVHITSHCTGLGQNESCTYSFVVVKSFDHQKVTM